MSLSYTKLVGRDASFQLIRTNPKLTSNVKLSVDSNSDLWLNSIPADPELAKDQYQRVAVDTTKSHEFNIFKFYNNGKTPSKLAFKIGSNIIQTVTAKDLKNQYDFDFYTSGAKYLESKQFSEKFSYFAPLYLNQILPDTFVIFKAKGASDFTAGQQLATNFSKETLSLEFFKNFQLVKAFDMRPETKIGRYLESILENPMKPSAPIGINFNSSQAAYSYYRGLSIKTGTYVELPVNTNSVLTRGLPILTKEKFIVSGFESNSIIHPNIVNLEFLFNDDTAEDFEINRYFGFYCNRIQLAEFDIDLESMYANQNDNTQALDIVRDVTEDVLVPIRNQNGVKLRGKNLTADVTDLKNSLSTVDDLFFAFLETKNDIHLIKPNTWNQYNNSVDFQIDDSFLDLGTTFGPGELFAQVKATVSQLDTKSTLAIKVNAIPANSSTIKVYHSAGTQTDSNGRFDLIGFIRSTSAAGGSFAFNQARAWSVEYTLGGEAVVYVSADGTPQDVAASITGAINDLQDSDIQSVQHSNYAFIQLKASGESFGSLKIENTNPALTAIGTEIDGFIFADGGTLKPHPVIDSSSESDSINPLNKINENKDQLLIKTNINWSRLKRVSRVTDNISLDQTDEVLASATSDFLRKGTILLVDEETPLTAHSNIEIRKIAKNKVGVFSIFEIKDFDFDIYSTNYNRYEELDLFKDFYEPVNSNVLNFRKYVYHVSGTGKVSVNGIEYASGQYVWQDRSELSAYSITQGDCVLVKSTYSPNAYLGLSAPNVIDNPVLEGDLATVSVEDNELKNFTGHFALRTPAIDLNLARRAVFSNIAEYRDKFTKSIVNSEYLINLEHQAIEFAIDNKLTPYICKWALKDSIDARSNPYRLNTDLIFGKDNFGPSHIERFPSAEKLTHEWFYIESDLGFTKDPDLVLKNFNYFENSFDVTKFSTEADYFDSYFQYVPQANGKQVGDVQLRYSDLFRDPYTGQFETVFKGAKYRFFALDPVRLEADSTIPNAILSTTDRFIDYRFSAILKVVPDHIDDNEPPVKFEIIENVNAKAIVAVVYLRLAGADQLPQSVSFRENGEPKVLSKSELLQVGENGSLVYENLYGDYRIKFNEDQVSNLTYSFLYFAKNKKYNSGDNSFSTIRLAKNIDLSFAGFTQLTGSSIANGLDITNNTSYQTSLVGQISLVPGSYSPLVYKGVDGARYVISEGGTGLANTTTSILNVVEDEVVFSSPNMYLTGFQISGPTVIDTANVILPSGSPQLWKENFRLYQINGGNDYYERVFQYFSFANFKYLLEDREDLITWKSYQNEVLANQQKITMRVQDANEIKLVTNIQNRVVNVTYNSKTVPGGYVYGETGASVPAEIHRYSGEYDAIFKPVSAFYQKTQIGEFQIFGANCSINVSTPNSFVLPEFNHIKHSTRRILDLENSPNYLAEYPILDETPIGTSSFNVLASSWDKGYHFNYLTKSTRRRLFGTRRIAEDYSFVSKLINVPTSVSMSSYSIAQITQSQYRSNTFTAILNWASYQTSVRFKFDLSTMFAKNFASSGLRDEFEKFFIEDNVVIEQDPEVLGELTLSEYIEEYAKQNLQRLYKVEEVQVWTKQDKALENGQIVFEQKSLDQLIGEGYSITKNVQINNQNSSVLEGNINKPINSGIRMSFIIKIKFI